MNESIIHCDSLVEFLEKVREYDRTKKDCYWEVLDVPKQLKVGLKVYFGEEGEEHTAHFTVRISSLKKESDLFSEEENKRILFFFEQRSVYSEAKSNYINTLIRKPAPAPVNADKEKDEAALAKLVELVKQPGFLEALSKIK